jgi:hypothetical protein
VLTSYLASSGCLLSLRGGVRSRLGAPPGSDWWRSTDTGDRLRDFFSEGTRPASEEIAVRIGFDPLDTKPLVSELSA